MAKYRLLFHSAAMAEWDALDRAIREKLRKILKRRMEQPIIPSARLHGRLADCYKIKLRREGYRLIYRVQGDALIIIVLAVGRRDGNVAYQAAEGRK